MTISALAQRVGMRPSAIRYYESIGLLPPAPRRSGQRVYDAGTLRRLAVIRQAQSAGFTLDETRTVMRAEGSLSEEWKAIAARKLTEIDEQIARLRDRQALIHQVQAQCQCHNADQCGGHLIKLMVSST